MSSITVRTGRLLAVAVAIAMALLIAMPAANAQEYPGGATFLTNDTNPTCGSTITLTGEGFAPNTAITLTVGGVTIGTVTSDASGNFSFPWTVPCTTIGTVTVTATDGATTLTINLNVRAEGTTTTTRAVTPGGTTTLPRTGSDSSIYVRVGVLLVSVGGLLVLGSRKRSNKIVKA